MMDDMRFHVLSKVFQSYQDDGRNIMKRCVHRNPVYVHLRHMEKISSVPNNFIS